MVHSISSDGDCNPQVERRSVCKSSAEQSKPPGNDADANVCSCLLVDQVLATRLLLVLWRRNTNRHSVGAAGRHAALSKYSTKEPNDLQSPPSPPSTTT